jgi:adhesin/invasin
VATFFNLAITGTAGDRTLNFSSGVLIGATSSAVTVTASGSPELTLTTQPSAAPANGIVFAQQPVVQLRDAVGNAVSQAGVVVTAAIASGAGILGGGPTATTNASGVAIFTNLMITGTIGNQALSFSAAGYASVTSNIVALGPGTATQITMVTQPSATAASGTAFALQPVLQVRDAQGNVVSVAGFTVTAALNTVSGSGTLGGATSVVTSAAGVASFAGLFINGTTPSSFTLAFSVPFLTGVTSSTIALTPGAATQMTITTQPSASAASGVAFAQQPVIQLKDAAGNAVSVAGTVVTAAIATGGGALGGTVTASTNASGVATFFNLAITGTAGDRTLNFSSGALIGATSSAVTVTASGSPQLALTTQPSAAPASGIVFAQQPVVQLRDALGNAVNQAGVVVTAAIASGAGTLGGTLTATTNASGVAIFTNLMITGTIGNQALVFSAAGYTSVTSSIVALGAGTATQVTINTQPSATAASGVAFALQPVLQVRDAQGNAVSVSLTVTATISSGSGTLNGPTSVVTSALGVATFAGLFINGTAGNFTLLFSVPSLTGATSSTIVLTAGAASQLTITTQPVDGAGSGGAFPTQPVIQLKDAAGNAVFVSGTVVTAALATGVGTLGGTLTATTNAVGVATFANLSITAAAGTPHTLIFTAPAVTAVISGDVRP